MCWKLKCIYRLPDHMHGQIWDIQIFKVLSYRGICCYALIIIVPFLALSDISDLINKVSGRASIFTVLTLLTFFLVILLFVMHVVTVNKWPPMLRPHMLMIRIKTVLHVCEPCGEGGAASPTGIVALGDRVYSKSTLTQITLSSHSMWHSKDSCFLPNS